jgi:DNA-binding protein H-NS
VQLHLPGGDIAELPITEQMYAQHQKEQMKARDQAPRPINENAHSSGWTGGAVEAVVAGRAGAAA